MTSIQKVTGIGPVLASLLSAKGISTVEQLAKTSPEVLRSIPRLGAQRSSALLAAAQKLVTSPKTQAPDTAAATPLANTEIKSTIHEEVPALKVKPKKTKAKADKKADAKMASEKTTKKAAKLEKDAQKTAKAAAKKSAKKVSAKAAKAEAGKIAKAKKKTEKKTRKALKAEDEASPKAKLEKAAKAKKKTQSKKKKKN